MWRTPAQMYALPFADADLCVPALYAPPRAGEHCLVLDTTGHRRSSSLSATPLHIASEGAVSEFSPPLRKICSQGQPSEAVDALSLLVHAGCYVSTSLLYSVLKACMAHKNLALGRRVHALSLRSGYQSNTFLANHFLRMYASHGNLQEAMQVFVQLSSPDTFMWFSIISAHAEQGEPAQAIKLYQRMRRSDVKPNKYVFVAALKACSTVADLESGRLVHADVLESGIVPDMYIGSCLVDMYAKCGRLEDARKAFDSLPTRNVVTWTSMIAGYAEHGLGKEALDLYSSMEDKLLPIADKFMFSCLLKACGGTRALQQGKHLHTKILERGLQADHVVGNCLVDMYAKCGSFDDARDVFDSLPRRDVVTWTSMIAGFADHGLGQEALALYARMEQEDNTVPNNFTFASLLKACASIGAIAEGKQFHSQIVQRGLEADIIVGNSLVDMYVKCGSLEEAQKVFDSLSSRNVVTWTSLITGCVEQGLGQEALALYAAMTEEGLIVADSFTFACLLKACTIAGALQKGKQIHEQIQIQGLETDVVIGRCLVDMYAKCGKLEDAQKVFDSLPQKDVITWTALINGFGQSNAGHRAIECFELMLQTGVQPDDTAFTCLLVACSHEGLVTEGQQYFKAMAKDHGIVPTRHHYVCMVDLLGRSGYVDEAEKLLMSMPFESDVVGWMALLNACRSHGHVDCGERCFKQLVRLDPENAGAYVLMGNIYADAGKWTSVDRVESFRKSVGASKKPAKAGIEVKRQVCIFVVGDESNDGVSSKWKTMDGFLKEGGYVPHKELVLKPVSDKRKEDALCGHAEKLALAYGLLNTPDGTPLLVTKNLRMCGDCHSATQIMSRVEKREIVVRDAHRVHRFVEGSCCCGGRP